MMVQYSMKNPNLEMTAKFDTFANRESARQIFSATLGREVEAWEIECKKI